MAKQKFEFTGGIWLFEREVARNWTATTYAVSEKQALSNLAFQAKKKMGLISTARVTLKGKISIVVD